MITKSLQQKVKKVLSSDGLMASPGMAQSLRAVSKYIPRGCNTLEARRRLQASLEEKSLSRSKELLTQFDKLAGVLDQVEGELGSLDDSVQKTTAALAKVRQTTSTLLQQAVELKSKRSVYAEKRRIVTELLSQFQLTPEQEKALAGGIDISEHFFGAIERIAEIKTQCRALLQTHQQVGLEIVESLAKRQESAFTKLFRWLQRKIAGQSDTSAHASDLTFIRGLNLLRRRPAYFSLISEAMSSARKTQLVKNFLAALCRGGPNGHPRPIEIHAGDPLRYVSDILAWIHQAVATERDFLDSIFVPRALGPRRDEKGPSGEGRARGDEKTPPSPDGRQEKDNDDALFRTQAVVAVSQIFEGVSRPLQVRLEQAIVFQPKPVLSYKITSVIHFYLSTLAPYLEPKCTFRETLGGLLRKAQQTFEGLIQAQTKSLRSESIPYTQDLAPPHVVANLIDEVRDLVKVHQECLVSQEDKDPAFLPSLDSLIGAIEACVEGSGKELGTTNGLVYLLNTLCALEAALKSSDPSVQQRLGKATQSIRAKVQLLIRAQSDLFMGKCGLLQAVQALAGWKKERNLSCMVGERGGARLIALAGSLAKAPASTVQILGAEKALSRALNTRNEKPKGGSRSKESKEATKPLSKVPQLAPQSLNKTLEGLYRNLIGLGSILTPECDRILDPWIRVTVREGVGLVVFGNYQELYETLSDPENQYPDPGAVLRHTPEQIKTLIT